MHVACKYLLLSAKIRAARDLDENEKGSHEHTHCSPALGGGVCPPMYPVCCGNGIHCGKTGPC